MSDTRQSSRPVSSPFGTPEVRATDAGPTHEATFRSRGSRRRRRLAISTAAATVVLVISAVALAVTRGDQTTSTPSTPSTATVTTTTEPTPSPTTTAPTPSAAEALAPFLSAAGTLDKQLQDAAAAINASGPPWESVGEETASLVKAADLAPVARQIPAGLPPDLLQSVILVYSDLASRRYAMATFSSPGELYPESYQSTEDLLRELGNGHEAAARFDSDLVATEALAAETPPIDPLPSDSRQAAEVLLLVQYVDIANGGCDSRGGAIVAELPAIVWTPPSYDPSADGTIGGIAFTTDLDTDGTWNVAISAC